MSPFRSPSHCFPQPQHKQIMPYNSTPFTYSLMTNNRLGSSLHHHLPPGTSWATIISLGVCSTWPLVQSSSSTSDHVVPSQIPLIPPMRSPRPDDPASVAIPLPRARAASRWRATGSHSVFLLLSPSVGPARPPLFHSRRKRSRNLSKHLVFVLQKIGCEMRPSSRASGAQGCRCWRRRT